MFLSLYVLMYSCIDLFSCTAANLSNKLTYLVTYLLIYFVNDMEINCMILSISGCSVGTLHRAVWFHGAEAKSDNCKCQAVVVWC